MMSLMAWAIISSAAFAADSGAGQVVVRSGTIPSAAAAQENFIGRVRTESLFNAQGNFTAYGANVTFEPGARTNWHIHPTGQVLIVTAGAGYTQEWGKEAVPIYAGDVVWCPPGVKHWHGAAPFAAMTHIAVSQTGEKPVAWLEPVDDEQYASLAEQT